MQANERLQLLATGSIRNAQGGVINGKDVTLTAGKDVINERSVTVHRSQTERSDRQQSFVDDAARIEAGSGLSITAGNDLQNIGGDLKSGADTRLNAGRDLLLVSAEAENRTHTWDRKGYGNSSSLTQYGSEVDVGGNLTATAGRDIAIAASHVKATGDVALTAQRDVSISAAANETHSESFRKSGGKKVQAEDSQVRQQASVVEAGGDLNVKAGGNLVVAASQLKAGDEAYLYAGEQLALLAAQDSDYHLFDKKNKGSFGAKETRRDEVTDVRNVGTQITSGGNLTLASEGDQRYQRARLESGGNLTLDSRGEIAFEAVKDLHQESHEKSKSSFVWNSMSGKGNTDETVLQSQLIAQGEIAIKAVEGLKIDIKQIDQKTVSETVDAMVTADPQLAWLKQVEQRGDVDWRRVKEIHDSFKYSHSGLGGGAAIIIAIIVAYFTAGAASGLVASSASTAGLSTAGGSVWAAGTGASLSGIGWANAAVTAGLTGMASNAAVSTINNRGNLGAVLKDVTSNDAMRGYVVAGVTAGLTTGVFDGWTNTETGTSTALPNSGAVTTAGGLNTWGGVGRFTGNQLLQNGTSTLVDRALGGDSKFSDALRTSLANAFAAAGFNWVGDKTSVYEWDWKDGSLPKIGLHALMGGLAAEAAGGDFKTGALAAGLNEAIVDRLAGVYGQMNPEDKKRLLVMNSQVLGVLTAAAQGGDEKSLQTGAWVAGSATQYNYLFHEEIRERDAKLQSCKTPEQCKQIRDEYRELSQQRDEALPDLCKADLDKCLAIQQRLIDESKLNWDFHDELRRKLGRGVNASEVVEVWENIQRNDVIKSQITKEYLVRGGDWELFKAEMAEALVDGGRGGLHSAVAANIKSKTNSSASASEAAENSTASVATSKGNDYTPDRIGSGQLGARLGSGGDKIVYEFGSDKVVGVLKPGKDIEKIDREISVLNKIDALGLPTVNAQKIIVDGKPAMLMDRFAQGSKEIVRNSPRMPGIIEGADTSLLNSRSVSDLKSIRTILVEKQIKIDDLQFLIGKDGRVVIADPLEVRAGAPSKVNLRTIDKLIEAASKRGN
uniref:DUF637 domain-containing protein n=1 Tax=Metapseudomonas otitidis TaxID=319939 RepID=UPI001F0B951F|nr:DUF637 domain-containing protein [Pseudomonas otitidis]